MIKEIKSCCVPVMSVMLVDWDEGFNYSIEYEIPISDKFENYTFHVILKLNYIMIS